MRRIQESVGYTGKYRSRAARYDRDDGDWKGAAQVALFLTMVGLVGPVIPKWGFYMWYGGWIVTLALFITSIVMMVKGAIGRGILALLFSMFVLPLWIIAAPIGVLMVTEGHGLEQALQEVVRRQEVAVQNAIVTSTSDSEAPPGVIAAPVEAPPVMAAPVIAAPAPVAGEIETITSKDGRTIRGTIDAYHTWGVRLKRDDGLVVNVTFELMSDGDAQKFREQYANRAR
jgi:hypothetical protein